MTTAMRTNRPSIAYELLRVSRLTQLTAHMVRITFTGPSHAAMIDAGPDQYTKIFFPLPGQRRPAVPPPLESADGVMSWYQQYLAMPDSIRPPMRTYTVRAQRPDCDELDIDFVLHPEHGGPASTWASQAAPGDEIGFLCPPSGLYCPQPAAAWQLLVGDESSIPAIGAIVERLGAHDSLRAFIEVSDPADELRFRSRGDVRIDWIHRGDRRHGAAVLDAVTAAEFPIGEPYAWISGEANLVRFVRRHLVRERGIDKHSITFTGYWRQGRTEEDNGREKVRRAAAGEPLTDEN